MPIAPKLLGRTGPIAHLPAALKANTEASLVVYNRVSSYAQSGRRLKLREKTRAVVDEVKAAAPGRQVLKTFDGVEEGFLLSKRHKLVEAAEYAAKKNCILVAADVSRFIRPPDYSRTTNRNARPREADYARLHEITSGVALATVQSPDLTEDERHSIATRRTGKAGRPRA